MQVRILHGDQYMLIDCSGEAPGRSLYDKISFKIEKDQNDFQLLIQTLNGPIVLDKDKTLSQQNVEQNNCLTIQLRTPTKEAKGGANRISDYTIYNQKNQDDQGQLDWQQNLDQNKGFNQRHHLQFQTPLAFPEPLESQIQKLNNQLVESEDKYQDQQQRHTIPQQQSYDPSGQQQFSFRYIIQQQPPDVQNGLQQQPQGPSVQFFKPPQKPFLDPKNQFNFNQNGNHFPMFTQMWDTKQKHNLYDKLKKDKKIIQEEFEISQLQCIEKDNKITKLEKQFTQLENKYKNKIDEINETHMNEMEEINQKHKNQVKEIYKKRESEAKMLNQTINSQKIEIQQLSNEIVKLTNNNNEQLTKKTYLNNQQSIQVEEYKNQINLLEQKNKDLQRKNDEKIARISNLEEETQNLSQQLEIIQKKTFKDQENTNQTIQQQAQKIRQLQSKVDEFQHLIYFEQQKREDRDKQNNRLQERVKDFQNEIELKEIEIKNNKKIINYLGEQSQTMQVVNKADKKFDQKLQQLLEKMEREIYAKKKQFEQNKKDYLRLQQQDAQQIEIQNERKQKIKLQKQQTAMKLKEIILNTQGILQVGLLVDVTGSMDKYKDATMNIIQRSMACIKDQTNRDCEWGAVCYQDFAELRQKGQYIQHKFTKDGNEMINFLKNINCDGGDDGAEDLRNGIKQMINNLKWEKYFKIALLICDAPCHGQKWAGNVLDNHPNEDLGDALQQLINKNIVLIGIEFTSSTEVMFAQMKNYYANQNKQSMLIVVDLKNKNQEQIQDQLINIISEASISITEVNKTGTKLKKQQNINRDGAFEALIKLLPDPTRFNLDPNIAVIQTKFSVYKVDINSKAFERNITTLFKIRIPQDYSIIHESEWNCIRTLKPFAFGQIKEVYLMKKIENSAENEVYVIKMPIGGQTYKTIQEALLECRSHLIAKNLMQRFIQELQDNNHQVPIKYSDFLILKEHDTSYWIAERFFQGEFIKFNNNYGYINPKKDLISILAQVFSYYTYHISEFQYMVCDIQGVGYNFTDPAINTAEGYLDEIDQGLEGIGQFIISFEKDKQNFYKKYLDIFELNY